MHLMLPTTPPPPHHAQTNTFENITFPRLGLQAVNTATQGEVHIQKFYLEMDLSRYARVMAQVILYKVLNEKLPGSQTSVTLPQHGHVIHVFVTGPHGALEIATRPGD